MEELKIVEAFAGYGSQRMALRNLGIAISKDSKIIEWTIDAIIANAAIHHPEDFAEKINFVKSSQYSKEQKIQYILNRYTLSTEKKKDGNKNYIPVDETQLKRMTEELIDKIIAANIVTNNLGSIMDTKGNEITNMDLLTYSFPCQDLSLAGNMKGITQTSRSGLLYQVERILKEQTFEERPKVLLLENVKNLVSDKFKPDFDNWIETLNNLGYDTTWKVLNARDYNVPQNRERVFAISIKKGQSLKFDYNNLKVKNLDKKLNSYLDYNINESYYLSDEHIKRIIEWNKETPKESIDSIKDISTSEYKNYFYIQPQENGENYAGDGLSNRVWKNDNYIGTIDTGTKKILESISPLRIRNITPKESLRLMGVKDTDINNMFKYIKSKGSQYKLSGNSIVIDVLELIFKELYNV